MNLNKEQLKEVEHLAGLLFSPTEILIILGVFDESKVVEQTTDKNFSTAFKRGKLMVEAELRKAIIDLAKKGSAPAQILADKMVTQSKLNDIGI